VTFIRTRPSSVVKRSSAPTRRLAPTCSSCRACRRIRWSFTRRNNWSSATRRPEQVAGSGLVHLVAARRLRSNNAISETSSRQRLGVRVSAGLAAELDEFQKTVEQFRAGAISEAQFRAIRVPQGIYEQRESGTYMLRVRFPAGGVCPTTCGVGEVASTFGNGVLHITTRQESRCIVCRWNPFCPPCVRLPPPDCPPRAAVATRCAISRPVLIPASVLTKCSTLRRMRSR